MFDIGFFELLLIAVVGLVVIGPERLPSTIRTIALYWGRIRRSVRDTRQEIEQQIGADDIRRQLHNEEVMGRLEQAEARLNESLNISTNTAESETVSDTPGDTSSDNAETPEHPKEAKP